jgi:hypothetical protein
MRNLSDLERDILSAFSGKLEGDLKIQFLDDLRNLIVKSGKSGDSRVVFEIKGYKRPPYKGQHAFPVEGKMLDKDGVEIMVAVYADENERILELELVKWSTDELIEPQFKTLLIY